MKDLKALRDELAELLDEAQAITNVAETEKRDLSADENKRWAELMDESKGLVQLKKAEIAQREKLETERKRLADARATANGQAAVAGVPHAGAEAKPEPQIVRHVLAPLTSFRGENAARDAYDCGLWLKAFLARTKGIVNETAEQELARRRGRDGGWDVRATMTEGSATAGGYVVPDVMSASIIDIRARVGVARQTAAVIPMTSELLDIPKVTGNTTVYYPGENGQITASDMSFGKISLVAKKRATLSYISQELQDDALISIVDMVNRDFAYKLADKEDDELINGDGTSTYGGVQGLLSSIGTAGVSTAATGHDTWADLDFADISAWMSKLPSKYRVRGVPKIICSQSFFHGVFVRLAYTAGGNTKTDVIGGLGADATFQGYPCYFTDKMPTATAASTKSALFGSFMDGVVLGDRASVRLALSNDFKFDYDVTALRATTRYDINVHEQGDSSNAGAYVALSTAS